MKISAEVSQMDKHLQNPPNNIYAQFGDKLLREIRRQAFDKCYSFFEGMNFVTDPKGFLMKADTWRNFFADPMSLRQPDQTLGFF